MMRTGTVALVAAIAATFGLNAAAFACTGSVIVSSCNQTCTSNCFLLNDLNCTTGQGITLSSGADLDLCGSAINCVSANCTGKAAVTMTASNSQVTNSLGTIAPAKFNGPWYTAVDCNNNTGSKVVGIEFHDMYGFGVIECAKVQQNVFLDGGLPAVLVQGGAANTDEVSDNYFRGYRGVYSYIDQFKVNIHNNLFAMNGGSTAIYIDSPSHTFEASSNVMLGENGVPVYDLSGLGTYGLNYCDPNNTDCTSCVSSGFCSTPIAPFQMP